LGAALESFQEFSPSWTQQSRLLGGDLTSLIGREIIRIAQIVDTRQMGKHGSSFHRGARSPAGQMEWDLSLSKMNQCQYPYFTREYWPLPEPSKNCAGQIVQYLKSNYFQSRRKNETQ
jgi:hypothetical protein